MFSVISTCCLCLGSKQLPINNNHESYLLSASSQSDMDEWIKAIRRVILSPFGGGKFVIVVVSL